MNKNEWVLNELRVLARDILTEADYADRQLSVVRLQEIAGRLSNAADTLELS